MEDSKVMSKKRWAALFVLLGIIIVGLIVGIVVLAIKNNTASVAVDEEWNKNVGCFENGTAYDIDVCISDIYDSAAENYNEIDRDELVVGLYDKAIDAAMTKGDWAKARELMIDKPNFFVLNDDCEKAMKMLDESQAGRLEKENEGIFYSYALDISVSCDDEKSINKWNDLLSDYNEGVESGFGF